MKGDKVITHFIDVSFRGNFMKELRSLREKTVEDVAKGVDDYRFWVGYVRCIDDIIGLSDDVLDKLTKE